MSLYRVCVTTTTPGNAGSTTYAAFSELSRPELVKVVNEWVNESFVPGASATVEIVYHDNEAFLSDLQRYDKVKVFY